ncbi:unnamed protein product [Chondrus crispus]|uniref:Secreted protein n=1 Tax=Chondrus crispus TaxID=2769 RepID=R7QAN3_CHOCR|nr:unnamed protein product [Chondrus crispus]CDF34505.1 unnamed protein product [Chondrus crispus]|eukprot:XP_005714324.1 unnamed protein product [Chondrus crispus]
MRIVVSIVIVILLLLLFISECLKKVHKNSSDGFSKLIDLHKRRNICLRGCLWCSNLVRRLWGQHFRHDCRLLVLLRGKADV